MGGLGTYVVAFVIIIEYSGLKFTMFVGIVIAIPFALGELLLGIEAIYIRDWKTLQIVSSLPWIVLVPMIWFLLPETPRWLIAKKRYIRWIRYDHHFKRISNDVMLILFLGTVKRSKLSKRWPNTTVKVYRRIY